MGRGSSKNNNGCRIAATYSSKKSVLKFKLLMAFRNVVVALKIEPVIEQRLCTEFKKKNLL